MKENFEKVAGIKELPIFPLPLILMPNEFLPLHIFEPRYRKMIKDIQIGRNIFGLSYLDQSATDSDKPEIGSIGCVAELRDIQMQEDGRSNILTMGVIRYEIDGLIDSEEPYFMAKVSFFEDDEEDPALLNPVSDEVFGLFKSVAKMAHNIVGKQGELPDIDQAEPEALSFMIAASFNLPNELKNELFLTRSTIERMTRLRDILRQTLKQTSEIANIQKISKSNGHSKKNIDLN